MTDNIFKQPNSWADRKLAELKAAGQSKRMPYVFLTSCVEARGEDINDMTADNLECEYLEMSWNCDLTKFEQVFGYVYDTGLELEKDPCVSYHRGIYRGTSCYYLCHSGIEYIWVNARDWKAEKVLAALERAGVEVDVP